MDKGNVAYLLNEMLLSHFKNGIIKLASKFTELEKFIMNEVAQTQNEKYSMYMFAYMYALYMKPLISKPSYDPYNHRV